MLVDQICLLWHNNQIECIVINRFLMFIWIFRIMRCRCCLCVSCNIMQYWIVVISSLSWKCCGDIASISLAGVVLFLYSMPNTCSFLMFSSAWTASSASSFLLRVDIFFCCKVFDMFSVIAYRLWLKFRPK